MFIVSGVVTGVIMFAKWVNKQSEDSVRLDAARLAAEHARAHEIQTLSERRALELIVEFPQLSDVDIATLMRDELLNMRSRDQRYFAWATPETVGRMRRTLVIEAVRAERDGVDVRLDK